MSNQSKMKKIPLLKAPKLVQKEIVEMLELQERINLSKTSNRAQGVVSCFKAPLNHLHIEVIKDDRDPYQLLPPLSTESTSVNTKTNEIRILCECPLSLVDPRPLLKHVRHLKSILDVHNFSLKYGKPLGLIETLSELQQCVDRFAEVVIGEYVALTQEELTYALENVTTNSLYISNKNLDDYENLIYRKSHKNELDIQKLHLENPFYADFEDLPTVRNIEVKYLNYWDYNYQLYMVNVFLNEWIWNRGNQIVEKIRFEVNTCTSLILKNVRTHPTQLTVAELNKVIHPIGREVVDIVRESDGLRATVITRENYEAVVIMLVWTEQNLREIGRIN